MYYTIIFKLIVFYWQFFNYYLIIYLKWNLFITFSIIFFIFISIPIIIFMTYAHRAFVLYMNKRHSFFINQNSNFFAIIPSRYKRRSWKRIKFRNYSFYNFFYNLLKFTFVSLPFHIYEFTLFYMRSYVSRTIVPISLEIMWRLDWWLKIRTLYDLISFEYKAGLYNKVKLMQAPRFSKYTHIVIPDYLAYLKKTNWIVWFVDLKVRYIDVAIVFFKKAINYTTYNIFNIMYFLWHSVKLFKRYSFRFIKNGFYFIMYTIFFIILFFIFVIFVIFCNYS